MSENDQQTKPIEETEIEGKIIRFNSNGLRPEEFTMVKDVARKIFTGAKARFKYALNRCTFFAEPGYDELREVQKSSSGVSNPRIEGKDDNPYDQHYWVAFDVKTERGVLEAVILDPIFGYVGLEANAKDVFPNPDFLEYYTKKRKVEPHKIAAEGGVRVKTIGI
ncbi:MAG: hypothetical protein Q7S79_02585 [bacterium]|nr:hypothetical protein [bacterium]